VSKLSPAEKLMEEARALAGRICRQPPDVLRMTKRLMREAQLGSFESVMEMSAAMQAVAHTTADHQEALAAFFEKRVPQFKGD
jgi:enoyl-CoA hydratase/carnithine racemase